MADLPHVADPPWHAKDQQLAMFPDDAMAPDDSLDFWVSPPEVIDPILDVITDQLRGRDFMRYLLVDPGCGTGEIALRAARRLRVVAALGIEVHPARAALAASRFSADGIGRVLCCDFLSDEAERAIRDALEASPANALMFVGNPPYSQPRETIGLEFIERCVRLASPQGFVAMHVPLDFATGVERCERIHERYDESALYPLKRRGKFGGNSSGQRPTAWFVWNQASPYSEWRPIG